ncbi:MAG: riboflavin synthase, partial [Terriglobales bacterium]
ALGGYRAGARVNLEPPLRMGDALGGHMLQGHVEGTGKLVDFRKLAGDAGWWLRLTLPEALLPFVVPKGSLAVDGISLTVATLERGQAGIAIIPHTWRNTHLRWLEPGAAMNLETDPIARHIERLLSARRESPALSVSALRRQGF